jgi:hypothetical protein
MTLENEAHQNSARHARDEIRNPFGVMDVPDPDGEDVLAFAAVATLGGTAYDDNAKSWASFPSSSGRYDTIEGDWCSRWNGGADPTIAGDAADKWKQGSGEVRLAAGRVYLMFTWDHVARRGLIDARRQGARLVGKYVNLTDPKIMRPWFGLIVSNQRIDGRWTGGRLDFRR